VTEEGEKRWFFEKSLSALRRGNPECYFIKPCYPAVVFRLGLEIPLFGVFGIRAGAAA
jgi:hypothetical protein